MVKTRLDPWVPSLSRAAALGATLSAVLWGYPVSSVVSAADAPTPASSQPGVQDPYLAKEYAFAEEVLNNPGDTEKRKINAITIAGRRKLRQYRPQLERLMKEDPSPTVRNVASRWLESWRRKDALVAERERRKAELRRRGALTSEQRKKEQDERERKSILMIRDRILQNLQSEKLADRREIMGSAGVWAKHLPETIPLLRKMVRSDSDPGIRMYALLAIVRAQPDSPETLALLRSCLGPENPLAVRGAAAEQICEWGEKAGLDVLIGQLSLDNVHFLAYRMKSLRGVAAKGDIGPPAHLLTKAEMPNAELTEDEKRQIREGAAAWQKWWKDERTTFVMPRARAAQSSSRPTTRPRR